MRAFPLHVKLIGAEDDRRYALFDVGEAPEYAVPTRAFQAVEIISLRLHRLVGRRRRRTTQKVWEKHFDETSGRPSLTEKLVAGFLDRTKRVRLYGNLGMIANEAGMVAVVFGDEPLQGESESKPCCDASGESTPRSDGSDHAHERFCLS